VSSYSIDIYGEEADASQVKGTTFIDFSSLAISAAKAYTSQEKLPCVSTNMLRHLIFNSILKVRRMFKNQYPELVIACDANHYWRKDAFEFYKAHRKASREDDGFDWVAFHESFNIITEEIRRVFPYKVLEVDECEADDVIGVLTRKLKHPMLVYAKDGDYHQCLKNPLVKLYNPYTQALVERGDVDRLLIEKICRGDAGDGIPNIFSIPNSFVDKIRQKPATEKKMTEFLDAFAKCTNSESDEFKRYVKNEELISFEKIPQKQVDDILAAYNETVINPYNKNIVFQYLSQRDLAQIGGNFASDSDLFC
jgi:hypothetical protein